MFAAMMQNIKNLTPNSMKACFQMMSNNMTTTRGAPQGIFAIGLEHCIAFTTLRQQHCANALLGCNSASFMFS
jgi:hypothetical protein